MNEYIKHIDEKLNICAEKLSKKNIKYPSDLAAGILSLIFSIAVLFIIPEQIQISEGDVINGRAFPQLLIYIMIACSVLLIIKEIYKLAAKQPINMKTLNMLVEIKALLIMSILIISYLLAKLTNHFIFGALFCSIAFMIYFRCKKKFYYAITISLAVIIWAIFRFILKVNF